MADTTRRAVVLGAGGATLAVALAACSGYGEQTGTSAQTETGAGAGGDAGTDAGAGGGYGGEADSAAPDAAAGGAAAGALTGTVDIPEGGGKVFKAQKVVVTQPSAGEFKCFSAVCPHQGCTVSDVEGGTINCPCHGSKFDIADGSVTNGPATEGLEVKTIKVDGESITLS